MLFMCTTVAHTTWHNVLTCALLACTPSTSPSVLSHTDSWIQFSEPLNISNASGPQSDCNYMTTIEENPTTLSLRITRQGNLAERIGVICYTLSSEFVLFSDFEERDIASNSSIVYFEPNTTDAVCEVSILDDADPEGTEKFTVRLQALPGSRSHVNAAANSVCVFIMDRDTECEFVSIVFPRLLMHRGITCRCGFQHVIALEFPALMWYRGCAAVVWIVVLAW